MRLVGVMIAPPARSHGMGNKRRNAPLSRAALAAGAVAATAGVAWAGGLFGGPGGLGPPKALAGALTPFDSCEAVLEYVDDHRWAVGYGGGPIPLGAAEAPVLEDSARLGAPVAAAGEGAVGPGESGTNVQEAGIDEPDVAKLDGDVLFALARDGLEAFDVSGGGPAALGRVELPGRQDGGYTLDGYPVEAQLLVADGRALVIGQFTERPGWEPRTRLTEIDVSDPAAMSVLRTMEIEGAYVSARLRGATAHLVLSTMPAYPNAPGPDGPSTGATGPDGPIPDDENTPGWLPEATLGDSGTGETSTAPLFGCDAVSYPSDFSGLGLLSVLTVDMEQGLPAVDTDVVMTNGDTVYASESSVYVATATLAEPEATRAVAAFPDRTAIHRFDTGDSLATSYAASGVVDGRLLGQWAMSEHEGLLRVASTAGDSWSEGPDESESSVTVLAERDGELERVGSVGGLGRGEEIYAVRFIGPLGYVVTFEQTDPLYTVDLSDPSDPRVAGELKIPGYSAYLHPAGGGLLLGVGQAGTPDGRLLGSQAAVFDVSDPSAPERLDALELADGRWSSSSTEHDHHAFLYWPEQSLAVVPVSSFGGGRFHGAVAMRVGPDGGLVELARFEDGGGYSGAIERMMVAGGGLVTVSRQGVAMRDLERFELIGSVPFAEAG
jgi:uncharacterized secreted protein with C-terminal beta-propeller domain